MKSNEFTLNELVKVLKKILVEYLLETADDPKETSYKAREKLEFECKVNLDTGIKKLCVFGSSLK